MYRSSYTKWVAKFNMQEGLQAEFELETIEKPALEPFLNEVTEITENMTQFRKTWIKFEKATEMYMTQNARLSDTS